MGSFGTRLHWDCNADPRVERDHRIIRRDCNADPGVERRGSTQLRESSQPGSIISSHLPTLLDLNVEGTRGEISAASPIALQSRCWRVPNEPIPTYGHSWPQRQTVW